MASRKGDTSQPFIEAVHNNASKTETTNSVPKMLQEEQPMPRPKPPAIGQAVDAQLFNQRWQQERKAAKQLDPFDAIDAEKKALSQAFKDNATAAKGRGQERE